MDVATVTSNGQKNSAAIALKRIQESMAGEAERAGFASPDDVENYIKSRRKNKDR